jgi:hypothetical protein
MRGSRRRSVRLAVATAVLLVGSGCAPGAPAEDGAAEAAPVDAAAPAAPAEPAEPEPREPAVDEGPWSDERLAEDLRLIAAHAAATDLAWSRGAAEAYAFLAEHSWPRDYTAEALLRCRTADAPTTFAALDADGFAVRASFDDPVPAPDWRFPPTDELLRDVGLRVYRVARTETVLERDSAPEVRTGTGHVAVDDEGRVLTFPTCTAYLPGGRPEVERELNDRFSELDFRSLVIVCDHYREFGVLEVVALFNADGWDLTLVEIRTVFVDRCAPVWEARPALPSA